MKKLASILGIGVISMAVALVPAFAQQTQPQGPAGSSTIQSKSDVKTPAANQAGKDEKNLPAKSGPDVKATAPAPSPKPMADVKTEKPAPAKTDAGVKDMKGANAKPGANLKSDKPLKSASHAKAVTAQKHHGKKSSGKVASKMRAKNRISNVDTHRKSGKSESTAPSTGK